MFSVWLEALALGPQVLLLCGGASQVEEGAFHFVAVSLCASLAFGYFWTRSAMDQYAEFQKEGAHVFYWGILSCAVIRVSLCVVFLYLFKKTAGKQGGGNHRGVDDVFADDMI